MEGPEKEEDQKEVVSVPVFSVSTCPDNKVEDFTHQKRSKFALRGFSTAVKTMAIKAMSMI